MAAVSPKLDLIRSVDALKINPLTRKQIGQGQHIYAYCNIRTNQVIYSLTQVLRGQRNLKQLPEAGNNTRPPKLRKDLWRPLWTLTLPHGFQGEAQGLEAWKRLNALRYMHELYWTPPKELSRNHTEEEMEQLQERLEDRGGSKKENVYDLIKRQKKKLRLGKVMDQKANSIADLAAVLVEQEEISERRAGGYIEEEVQRMLSLNKRAEEGALEVIEARIARLNEQIKELVKTTPVDKEGADSVTTLRLRAQRYRTRRALRDSQKAKEEMEHALLMVSYAKPATAKPEVELQDEETRLRDDDDVFERQETEAQNEEERHQLEVSPLPEEPWNDLNIKFLRHIKNEHREVNTNAWRINPHFDSMRQAREVLMQPHEDIASKTPEELEQQHTQRLDALTDMVHASKTKLGEFEVQEIGSVEASSGKPKLRNSEKKQFSPEQMEAVKQIKVWNAMIAAYRLTGGTLEVEDPDTGEVVHIGASNSDDVQSTSVTDYAQSETAALETARPNSEPLNISTIRKPTFSMDGVKVTWQNIMDAEFAPVWPAAVQHEWMGITRHAAPKPEAEPMMTAQEYYEGKKRLKAEEDETEAEKVRQDVVKSVAGSIIKRLIGSRPKSQKKPAVARIAERERVEEVATEAN